MFKTADPPAVSTLTAANRHEVCVLDPKLLRRHRGWRARGQWRAEYSLAAWLRFPEGLSGMVQLMLCIRDQERRKSFLIDRCHPNHQTLILMNGIVRLDVSGDVSEMSLWLSGPAEDAVWMLDEYHFEAFSPALQSRQKRSAMRG